MPAAAVFAPYPTIRCASAPRLDLVSFSTDDQEAISDHNRILRRSGRGGNRCDAVKEDLGAEEKGSQESHRKKGGACISWV